MATTKPFTTQTVETKGSVVNDQLKPTAEIHILIGGPYVDGKGEEHQYGHTALRIRTQKLDITYDFGRYGKISGTFGESGDGILRVWTDFKPYIAGEIALHRITTDFMYAVFDHQVDAVKAHFDVLIAGGKEIPNRGRENMKVYKLATDYHALGPNCTTISIDGAKAGIPRIETGSAAFNRPEDVLGIKERLALQVKGGATRLFLPANLQTFLSSQNAIKPTTIQRYGSQK